MEPRAKNTNGVPPSRWRRWSERDRHVFNKIMDYSSLHPEAMSSEDWREVCYNFAVLATDIVRRSEDARYWRRTRHG